ncbi:glutaredoxin 2 [Photobacterium sp. 1_MG-2023]|uniref:glutaredoxin 2 n=1 Tax=Photobacterium sp. 1_MG-2023 TaxID=3062646 RepID=UPI0026E22ACA|nr:glutaredoxin 2 [Photobacterium sp. 1_MG-2023]MDO6704584.1 glutaredoxin 2 [Photobacterium sp. 1_MG-2023]
MKLFVFDHCPYCIKAMMVAGLKQSDIELVYLQNHDVQARIDKVGANMVPILQKPDGSYMAESLDIAHYLDTQDGTPRLTEARHSEQIAAWTAAARPANSRLVYPRWLMIDLPEFQCQEAKDWFEGNKSAAMGQSFAEAYANSAAHIETMSHLLAELDWLTLPSERNNQLSLDDVNLFPTLRNLTVVKGLTFPPRIRQYIDEVAALTGITLYEHVAV